MGMLCRVGWRRRRRRLLEKASAAGGPETGGKVCLNSRRGARGAARQMLRGWPRQVLGEEEAKAGGRDGLLRRAAPSRAASCRCREKLCREEERRKISPSSFGSCSSWALLERLEGGDGAKDFSRLLAFPEVALKETR